MTDREIEHLVAYSKDNGLSVQEIRASFVDLCKLEVNTKDDSLLRCYRKLSEAFEGFEEEYDLTLGCGENKEEALNLFTANFSRDRLERYLSHCGYVPSNYEAQMITTLVCLASALFALFTLLFLLKEVFLPNAE